MDCALLVLAFDSAPDIRNRQPRVFLIFLLDPAPECLLTARDRLRLLGKRLFLSDPLQALLGNGAARVQAQRLLASCLRLGNLRWAW